MTCMLCDPDMALDIMPNIIVKMWHHFFYILINIITKDILDPHLLTWSCRNLHKQKVDCLGHSQYLFVIHMLVVTGFCLRLKVVQNDVLWRFVYLFVYP